MEVGKGLAMILSRSRNNVKFGVGSMPKGCFGVGPMPKFWRWSTAGLALVQCQKVPLALNQCQKLSGVGSMPNYFLFGVGFKIWR